MKKPFASYSGTFSKALLIPMLLLALLAAHRAFAGWDYGNGRHGTCIISNSTTIEQLYQTVRLTNDPPQYNPFDSNAIPNFQSLLITNGATLTANPWNGTNGGWIVLKVQCDLSIASNSAISASAIGYRGGIISGTTPFQGESYAGTPAASVNANYGAGGAGDIGGGGGYGTPGGSTRPEGGAGGNNYGVASLTTIYLGSGGGAADWNNSTVTGGNGGGAIVINAGNLLAEGSVLSVGGSPQYFAGGGSGGSILLQLGSGSLGQNNVNASGGLGGPAGNGYAGGAGGGVGRIAIACAEGFTGSPVPTPYITNDSSSDSIHFTSQSTFRSDFLGTNVVLTMAFNTLASNTMQWFFNGSPMENATNSSLVLTNLSFTNQGNYWLDISVPATTIASPKIFLTVLDTNMPFADGIPNWWKSQYGLSLTDPTLAHRNPPADLLTYLQKYLFGLNPLTNDTDGDGITDYAEIFGWHSNPLSTNTAGDGIPDSWKMQNGLNPALSYASVEIGTSGVTYSQVYDYDLAHTNAADQLSPSNPFFAPGTSIYEALNQGQHTNSNYFDKNDRLLGVEYSQGFSIGYQYDGNDNLVRQVVLSRASESNGLPVLWRFLNGITNSNPYADSDGDGWTDYQEWKAGTSPTNALSTPSVLGNPGTNLASLSYPFIPSNFVMGTGPFDAYGAGALAVGADGNPGTNSNFLLLLTQNPFGWTTQRVNVGPFGVESIAIGQPTNRPNPGIYVGLRGSDGFGRILEFTNSGGVWQSNVLAISADNVANVLSVRSNADVLISISTNGITSGFFSLSFSNSAWNCVTLSTNIGAPGIGTHGTVWSRMFRDAGLRLVNTNQIEMFASGPEAMKNNLLLPTNWVFNTNTGKYYFQSTNTLGWFDGEIFAEQYGTHLVTISDTNENAWVENHFPTPNWIGLYMVESSGQSSIYGAWTSSGQGPNIFYATYNSYWEANPFYNFQSIPPYIFPRTNGVCLGLNNNNLWNCRLPTSQYYAVADATGVSTYSNRWLLPPTFSNAVVSWPEAQLAAGSIRLQDTNGSALLACYVSDQDASGTITPGDQFVLVEYRISGDAVSILTQTNVAVGSEILAQSFAISTADYLSTGQQCVFTAEPCGQIYSWTAKDNSSPLQRQLLTAAYSGKAWQSLAGVKMIAGGVGGEGLVGLMVDPTNQNACQIVLWPPQPNLPAPFQLSDIETAPSAIVLPASDSLGTSASVNVRLWDAEGNASTPIIQYQLLGSTNWQNAAITELDGMPYGPDTRAAAWPGGVNHTLVWNVAADLGTNAAVNVLLRACAKDFLLTGNWSAPVSFAVNTFPPLQISASDPVQNASNGFSFQISGLNGSGPIIIYASTNLLDWDPIFTNPAMMGTTSFTDQSSTNYKARFYKAVEQ